MGNVALLGFSDPISSWTHLLAALFALIGGPLLVRKGQGNTARIISLVVFTFTLVFLFSMSGVFHLLDRDGTARPVLQRLDHAAIWTMIAGTFTPIHIILFRGGWRWGMLLLVWTIAITGLVLEVVFFTSFPEWLLLILFLGLGWLGAFSMIKFRKLFRDPSIKLLTGGGLAYSIGAVFDFSRWPIMAPGFFGPHELFHVFVILGALLHWLFIFRWAHHPTANTIIFEVRVFPGDHMIAKARDEHLAVEARSNDELKALVRDLVREKFHNSIEPTIHLRYFKEEILP